MKKVMTRKIMTRREALLACKEIWEFIEKHDFKTKHKALIAIGKFGMYINDCPACDYSNTHKGNHCNKNCILSWAGEDGCLKKESEYRGNSDFDAGKIVELCNIALSKLK